MAGEYVGDAGPAVGKGAVRIPEGLSERQLQVILRFRKFCPDPQQRPCKEVPPEVRDECVFRKKDGTVWTFESQEHARTVMIRLPVRQATTRVRPHAGEGVNAPGVWAVLPEDNSNPSGDDHEYQTRLLRRGAYLQYDMIGMQVFYADQQASCTSDEDDARNIARLVRDGFGEKVLMSQDIFLKTLLRSYGGPGYGHMVEFFLPRLARHGVPLERGIGMMTANPRRLFESAS